MTVRVIVTKTYNVDMPDDGPFTLESISAAMNADPKCISEIDDHIEAFDNDGEPIE